MTGPIVLNPGTTVHVAPPVLPSVSVAPPDPNPVGAVVVPVVGPRGPQGEPGQAGDARALAFVHYQYEPATLWQVQHDLGFMPGGITVTTDDDEPIEYATISWPSASIVEITFGNPITGKAVVS